MKKVGWMFSFPFVNLMMKLCSVLLGAFVFFVFAALFGFVSISLETMGLLVVRNFCITSEFPKNISSAFMLVNW